LVLAAVFRRQQEKGLQSLGNMRSATCQQELRKLSSLEGLVELSGIEPLTSSLRTRRSPN
jgi:hypothetical protein